jgi:hypothetical protein
VGVGWRVGGGTIRLFAKLPLFDCDTSTVVILETDCLGLGLRVKGWVEGKGLTLKGWR